MADFIFERDDYTVIVLRVPRKLWDRWEYRHTHYGNAIHALRETVIQVLAQGSIHSHDPDRPDPFYTEGQS